MQSGDKLSRYTILEKIGQGGMGEVYRARDEKLNREVALKILPADVAADRVRLTRFEREARTAAALNHSNIVTIYSVEEENDLQFITMELVEGRTLTRMLAKKSLSLGKLLEIAIPLADAVSHAHRAGLTHRDLKPDNIMIDKEGRLRVLDFGLAKRHDQPDSSGTTQAVAPTEITREGTILGTVSYMSPEQAEGRPVDPRSDVFSLGVILYEMATGKRPFRGETSMSIIGSILKDEPTPATELNRSLPRDVGRILRRCLAKDPERRYQTALGLRNELEELKAETDSGELLDSTGSKTGWPKRKSQAAALLVIAAAVAIASVIAVRAWIRPDTTPIVYSSVPITSTLEFEVDPHWSPSSEFIAFGRLVSGSIDLFVQPVTGGEAILRAGGPGDQTVPRWSPDGEYLAYISSYEPGSYVYIVPPHGGTPRKLIATNIPALDIDTSSITMGNRPWSPDSKTLLVSRFTDSGQLAIFRVDRGDGSAQQLTFPPAGYDDSGPSYSFAGGLIAFSRKTDGRGALMTMPAGGGEPELLLASAFSYDLPAWRPGDRQIVFQSNEGDVNMNLWELDVATGSLRQLTYETKKVSGFSVSANNRIAYAPFWHDTFLYVVDLETGERRQLTSHTADNYGARFSPDGRTIAYHSTRDGDSEIWLYHLNGDPETQITNDPATDLYADWSPDGQQLVFVSNRDDDQAMKVYLSSRDGGRQHLLVDQAVTRGSDTGLVVTAMSPRWSPDGEQIAYIVAEEEGHVLWSIRPDGSGARKRIVGVKEFDWYLDSRRGVYTRHRCQSDELVTVDLETGQERSLWSGPHSEVDVAPDGSYVVFSHGRGHFGMGLSLLRLVPPTEPGGLPFALSEPEDLVRPDGAWHVHHGSFAADSRSVVYTKDTDYGDIYELVERR
jgi:serine/threonine protein kinase